VSRSAGRLGAGVAAGLAAALLLVAGTARPAFASDCSNLSDCYSTIAAGILAAVAIGLLLFLFWEFFAAAAVEEGIVIEVEELELTQTVANHATDVVLRGEYAGQLSRPYLSQGTTQLVQEIMEAGQPIADPGGVPGALRWDIPGAFRDSEGIWELVVDPIQKLILHLNFVT
jgi:hypothetical protein